MREFTHKIPIHYAQVKLIIICTLFKSGPNKCQRYMDVLASAFLPSFFFPILLIHHFCKLHLGEVEQDPDWIVEVELQTQFKDVDMGVKKANERYENLLEQVKTHFVYCTIPTFQQKYNYSEVDFENNWSQYYLISPIIFILQLTVIVLLLHNGDCIIHETLFYNWSRCFLYRSLAFFSPSSTSLNRVSNLTFVIRSTFGSKGSCPHL